MNTAQKSLFQKETVFISKGGNSKEVFQDISEQLQAKGLVKKDFLESLLEREENYPTGIDLSVINNQLPNIAIPHTESEFVNTCRIVPIKLTNSVVFKNMIQPDKELNVSFLFMLLNNSPSEQANMLAEIMDFLNSTDKNKLENFFDLKDERDIYEFLTLNFN